MNIQHIHWLRQIGSLCIVVITGLFNTTVATAQSVAYLPDTETHKEAKAPDIKTTSMALAVFRVEQTMKFKIHLENYADSDVQIKLTNSKGKILYKETIDNANKYIRAFNVGMLDDDDYQLEITNGKEVVTKNIHIKTPKPQHPSRRRKKGNITS